MSPAHGKPVFCARADRPARGPDAPALRRENTRACRPKANRELLVDQTLVGHMHGAARDAELSRQIPPGRQPCAGGKPPRLDGTSDRLVDLRGQRRPSSTIDVDGEGGHRTMVPSELQILVLFL
jgi:hypothetical protein